MPGTRGWCAVLAVPARYATASSSSDELCGRCGSRAAPVHDLGADHGTHPQGGVVPVAEAQDLGGQGTSSAEHGPAAVDQLSLLEAPAERKCPLRLAIRHKRNVVVVGTARRRPWMAGISSSAVVALELVGCPPSPGVELPNNRDAARPHSLQGGGVLAQLHGVEAEGAAGTNAGAALSAGRQGCAITGLELVTALITPQIHRARSPRMLTQPGQQTPGRRESRGLR